jgi:hypothetical protein
MQKTKKKNIKVRDLKPKKDAKGGGHYLGAQTGSHNASHTGSHTGSHLGSHTGSHN